MTDAFCFNILISKSTCVLLQRVLPLLAAEQHHQLNHGGRRLERVDCLMMENDVRRLDWTKPDLVKITCGCDQTLKRYV